MNSQLQKLYSPIKSLRNMANIWEGRYTPIIKTLGKWRQEDHKLKVILAYESRSKPSWATRPYLKNAKHKNKEYVK